MKTFFDILKRNNNTIRLKQWRNLVGKILRVYGGTLKVCQAQNNLWLIFSALTAWLQEKTLHLGTRLWKRPGEMDVSALNSTKRNLGRQKSTGELHDFPTLEKWTTHPHPLQKKDPTVFSKIPSEIRQMTTKLDQFLRFLHTQEIWRSIRVTATSMRNLHLLCYYLYTHQNQGCQTFKRGGRGLEGQIT